MMLLTANEGIELNQTIIGLGGAVLFSIVFGITLFKRFKRCPADKVLIVSGKQANGKDGLRFYTSGAIMVWPIIQDYAYLDLKPISLETVLKGIRSKSRSQLDIQLKCIAAVSKDPVDLESAASRILSNTLEETKSLLKEMLDSRLKRFISTKEDRELEGNVEEEIKQALMDDFGQLGIKPLTINMTELTINTK